MKRKTEFILLAIDILLGSIVTFFACNMLMSDVSNMFYGVHDCYIVASFPAFMLALDFSVALVFIIRFCRYPQFKKNLAKLYSLYLCINSLIGVVTAIFTASYLYHDLFARFVFPGYTFISLLIHLALLVLGIYLRFIKVPKMEEDKEKKKIKFHYVLYSGLLGGMVFFAFNKFGALLYAPMYIYWRNLYLTFTFYLSLLLPISLVIHVIKYFTDGYVGKEKHAVITVSIILVLTVILCGSVLILGSTYTQFISAVSPALPLERLDTKPLNSIFMFIALLVFGVYYLYYAIRTYKLAKQK